MMYDIGKSMGIYFYVVGLMQISSIFIIKHFTNNIYIDLQFIGHVAVGYFLMKHHEKTRKTVVIVCGIFLLIIGGTFLYAM